MKNLKQLLGICEHKWKLKEKIAVHGLTFENLSGVVGHKYILECENCGMIEKKEV